MQLLGPHKVLRPIMVNLNVFLLAFTLIVVRFECSKADRTNNDVAVLERLLTLERELHETRIATGMLTMELRESKIEHAKAIQKLNINHDKTTEKLRKDLSDTSAELKAIKNIFNERASTTYGLNESSSVHKISNAVLARAARQTGTYAFTAYLDHTIQHLGIDQTIIFNQVHVNVENAYNRFSGIFTCPVDGTYVFSFFVSNYYRKQVVAELVMDGRRMLHAIADTDTQPSDHFEVQGGNLAVLNCPKGSGVWVTNKRYADCQISAADDARFASFSGFLLS